MNEIKYVLVYSSLFGKKIDMHHNKKWDFIEATPQKTDLSIT